MVPESVTSNFLYDYIAKLFDSPNSIHCFLYNFENSCRQIQNTRDILWVLGCILPYNDGNSYFRILFSHPPQCYLRRQKLFGSLKVTRGVRKLDWRSFDWKWYRIVKHRQLKNFSHAKTNNQASRRKVTLPRKRKTLRSRRCAYRPKTINRRRHLLSCIRCYGQWGY